MSMIHDKIIQVVNFTAFRGFRKATAYISPELTIVASRQFKKDRRIRGESIVLTIGKPNYKSRGFIRLYQKAGGSFPVRKIQLEEYKKK